MRTFMIVVPVIILIAFSFLPAEFDQAKLGGQRVPDFVTSALNGERFVLMNRLQRPDHKVLVLTFCATWCEHCDDDLKFFQSLQDQYADQGLRVFFVFTGSLSRIKAAKKYLEEMKIEIPVLVDKKRGIAKRYKVAGFPCTYAIDKKGFLKFKCLGCSKDVKRELEAKLKNLLTNPS